MPKTSAAKIAAITRWRKANPERIKAYNRRYMAPPEVKKKRNATMARWRKNNAERVKDNYRRRRDADPEGWKLRFRKTKLKQKYGITLDDYDQMLTEQDGVCAICGGSQDHAAPWRLAVDHDRETGRVRELLCSACNTGLGSFTHNPVKLQAAIAYLKKHKEVGCK
jgi:hypothetical protein